MEPHDAIAAAVVGHLHGVDPHTGRVDGDHAVLRTSAVAGDDPERFVESFRLGDHLGESHAVREQRQSDLVMALIGIGIGVAGGAGQAHPDTAGVHPGPPEQAMAIAPVVEHGDPETRFGDVDEAMGAHLELGGIPGRRRMGRSSDVSELDVAGRRFGADVEREHHRQQVFGMMPLDLDGDVEPGTAGPERVGDPDPRRADVVVDAQPADQRPRFDEGDRHRTHEFLGQRRGPALEVPGVVAHGVIGAEGQECTSGSRRDDLTGVGHRSIDEGDDGAGVVEPDRDRSVEQGPLRDAHDVGDGLRPGDGQTRWPHGDAGGDRAVGQFLDRRRGIARLVGGGERLGDDHLVTGHTGGVHHGRRRWSECVDEAADPFGEIVLDPGEGLLGLGVDPGDRRARENVVELQRQELTPQVIDARRPGERRGPQLELSEQALATTIAELGPQLARQGPPVGLEVELTPPDRDRRSGRRLAFDLGEEPGRCPDLDAGRTVEIGHAAGSFDHLDRRPATPVAVTERRQRPLAPSVFPEALARLGALGGADLGVVGVDGREVGEDPGAVETLPPERVVREAVRPIPRELLRDEPRHSAGGEQLRQPGRVAEHVGDPHLGAADPESLLEVALTEDDLAGQALPRRQVHVGLDPHAPDRDPLPALDVRSDPLEQVGVPLLDPGVLLGLRAHEPVVGMVVEQPDRRREGPGALADGLAHRPQPGGVDVGMADGHHPVGTGPGRYGECRCQQCPGPIDIGDDVECRCDGAQQSGPPGIGEGQRTHDAVEDVEIVDERLGLGVDEDQFGPPETVDGVGSCRLGRAHRRGPERGERRVRCGFEEDRHRTGFPGQSVRGAPRMDALHRPTGLVDDEPLALEPGRIGMETEIDDGLDPSSSPGFGDFAVEPEPGGAPGNPPPTVGQRSEVVGRRSGEDVDRAPFGVGQRKDPFPELALDPFLDEQAFIVHSGERSRAADAGAPGGVR